MSRSDQWIGLNERAKEMVMIDGFKMIISCKKDGTIIESSSFPCLIPKGKREVYSEVEGAFYTTFNLYMYTLEDGTELYEAVQAEPWSSGPCYFVALKDAAGKHGQWIKESLWTDEEMRC